VVADNPTQDGASKEVASQDGSAGGTEVDWRQKLEEQQAAAEANVSNLTSSYQSKLAEQEKAHEATLNEMRLKLREFEVSQLTDEERVQYEQREKDQEYQDLRRRAEEAEQRAAQAEQERDGFKAWENYFSGIGIQPDQSLALNEYIAHGHQLIAQRLGPDSSQAPTAEQQPSSGDPAVVAPNVLTGGAGNNTGRPTYAEIAEQWKGRGGLEGWMSAIREGRLIVKPEDLPLS
jgi:hypothetical protein